MKKGKERKEKLQKTLKQRDKEHRKKDLLLEEANVTYNELMNIENVYGQ